MNQWPEASVINPEARGFSHQAGGPRLQPRALRSAQCNRGPQNR